LLLSKSSSVFKSLPPTKSPAPQSELYNVILHTHKVPRPLVQRLHTLFSTARLTRSSLFLDSIDEWNEQKHSQCVCVCVCVHLSVEGIACTFFKTIVSLHKPPTFGGETNHFSVFFLFSEMKYHRCEVVYLFIYKCKRTKSCVSLKKIASLEKVKNKKK
jgi:hypothetical protein